LFSAGGSFFLKEASVYHSNKLTFFHGFLIAMVSVCNYFIKLNDAIADIPTVTVTTSTSFGITEGYCTQCKADCGDLAVLSCFTYLSGGAVHVSRCVCGCDPNLLSISEYVPYDCGQAVKPGGSTCSAGGWCTFSHCATKDFYCFSFVYGKCDPHSRLKCRRVHWFDAAATSRACSCQYFTSYTSETKNCYEFSYYGTSCNSSCLSYRLPTGAYVQGKRSTLIPGGAITDCFVDVPAGCDSTGCYKEHKCPYKN